MAQQDINTITVSGRLGRDAEVKFLSSGTAAVQFSIANNQRVKKGEEWVDKTQWFDIVKFGREKIADYLKKGTQVSVCGRLQYRDHEKDDGTKVKYYSIVADTIVLAGGGRSESDGGTVDYGSDEPTPF
jgi:single-strand DNA-binding protein